MRVIAFDRFREGVTLDQIQSYLPEEVSNVWRLWKAGRSFRNLCRARIRSIIDKITMSAFESTFLNIAMNRRHRRLWIKNPGTQGAVSRDAR
jgi:hypothetical protein